MSPDHATAEPPAREAPPRLACWTGVSDAVSWHRTLQYWVRLQTSSSISAQQCFVLNGTLFIGSIVLFNLLLTPLLTRIGEEMAWLDGLGQQADNEALREKWARVLAFVQELSSVMFQAGWLVPLYGISIVLNAVFNVDIAKQVYTLEHGEPVRSVDSLSDLLRDSMYNYLLMAWVSLFCWGVHFVRFVGPLISLVWTSWAIAFYAYDLAWSLKGWEFQRRLLVFQNTWLYMLGFGLPSALVTFFLPQFLGYGVYALALPVTIILATTSRPQQHEASWMFPRTLRVFLFAEYINLALLRLLGLPRSRRR